MFLTQPAVSALVQRPCLLAFTGRALRLLLLRRKLCQGQMQISRDDPGVGAGQRQQLLELRYGGLRLAGALQAVGKILTGPQAVDVAIAQAFHEGCLGFTDQQ